MLIVEARQQLDQNGRRVRDRAAVAAGVEVLEGSADPDLEIGDPAQTVRDRGRPLVVLHAGVAHHAQVGRQELGMCGDELVGGL